jgi:hypothetical protein
MFMQEINPDLFSVNSAKGIDIFNGRDILYMVADNKGTDIYLMHGRKFSILKSLTYCCNKLSKYITCNGCSIAVNMNRVKKFIRKRGTIIFADESELKLKPTQAQSFQGLVDENINPV